MTRVYVTAPLCTTPEACLDWLEANGVDLSTVRVWRGPDAMYRARGKLK